MKRRCMVFAMILFTVICTVLPSSALANDEVSTDDASNSNIIAEVSNEDSEEDDTSNDIATASLPTVQCYISKDGAWTLVDTVTATGTASFNGRTRNYISAKSLENVYGKYGYSIDDYGTDSKIFAHNSNSSTDCSR